MLPISFAKRTIKWPESQICIFFSHKLPRNPMIDIRLLCFSFFRFLELVLHFFNNENGEEGVQKVHGEAEAPSHEETADASFLVYYCSNFWIAYRIILALTAKELLVGFEGIEGHDEHGLAGGDEHTDRQNELIWQFFFLPNIILFPYFPLQ